MGKRGFKEEFSLNTDLKKYRSKKTNLKKQLLCVRGVSKEEFSVKTDLKNHRRYKSVNVLIENVIFQCNLIDQS